MATLTGTDLGIEASDGAAVEVGHVGVEPGLGRRVRRVHLDAGTTERPEVLAR